MGDKKTSGYVAGVICLVVALVFGIAFKDVGWNTQGQVVGVFIILFGGLGIGSLWKPDIIGPVAARILEGFTDKNQGYAHRWRDHKNGIR